ncbi:MAG: T9SS type A sorting domain-containing protein [Ignavibacterium sp.]|nr:T9SS type A sorting domain-containing protein [Ignavibacterium sp.]
MKKINTFLIITLLMLIFSATLYSQNNRSEFFKTQKHTGLIEKLSAQNSPSVITKSDNKNLRSAVNYKILENGFVLESVKYQLYTGSGWLDFQNEFNTYDNNFNLIETVVQIFNSIGLENFERMSLTYYLNNTLESKLTQLWDGVEWADESKTVYQYDAQGRYTEVNHLLPDGSGGFAEYVRELYTYESNLKKEFIETQQFNNGTWDNLSFTEAIYFDEERIQEVTNSGWNGIEYQFNDKQTFTYSSGLLIENLNLLWTGSEWVNTAKQTYEYDAQERITESLSLSFNESTQGWENVFRMTNTYYGTDSLITILQSGNINEWENLAKVSNMFRADGNLTGVVSYEWDTTEWLPLAKGDYDYDANGNLKLYIESVYEDNEWSVFGRAIYTYIPTNTTDVNDDVITTVDFKLNDNYPNPFNPSTVISWQSSVDSRQTLKVFDILGNEVVTLIDEFRPAGKHSIEFNASVLASGIYLYKIESQSIDGAYNFSAVKKMMLIK